MTHLTPHLPVPMLPACTDTSLQPTARLHAFSLLILTPPPRSAAGHLPSDDKFHSPHGFLHTHSPHPSHHDPPKLCFAYAPWTVPWTRPALGHASLSHPLAMPLPRLNPSYFNVITVGFYFTLPLFSQLTYLVFSHTSGCDKKVQSSGWYMQIKSY